MTWRHRAWAVAGVTFVALVAAAAFRSSTGVLLEPVSDEFGWSRATVSFAVTVNLVLYGVVAPFAAALMEKFGIRRVVAAALVLLARGWRSPRSCTQPWQLVLLWGVFVGVGAGCLALVFGAIVAQRWFVARRGLVTGVFSAASRDRAAALPADHRAAVDRPAAGARPRCCSPAVALAGRAARARCCCASGPATSGCFPTAHRPTGSSRAPLDDGGIGTGAHRRAAAARGVAHARVLAARRRLLHLRLVDQRPRRHPLHPRRARPRPADHRRRRRCSRSSASSTSSARSGRAGSPTATTRASCSPSTTACAASRCCSCTCSGRRPCSRRCSSSSSSTGWTGSPPSRRPWRCAASASAWSAPAWSSAGCSPRTWSAPASPPGSPAASGRAPAATTRPGGSPAALCLLAASPAPPSPAATPCDAGRQLPRTRSPPRTVTHHAGTERRGSVRPGGGRGGRARSASGRVAPARVYAGSRTGISSSTGSMRREDSTASTSTVVPTMTDALKMTGTSRAMTA